ncbi:MAG: hypothetical protein NVS3B3_23410 [Aquirhabdus sp.]
MTPPNKQNDKDDVNQWVKKLHFEPEQQVREFKDLMHKIAGSFLQERSVPYLKQTSQEISSKLKRISSSLTKAVKELSHLKVYGGQDLEKSPANLPIICEIETAYAEQRRADKKLIQPSSCCLTSRIENIEELLSYVNRAVKNTSKPGNSSSRRPDTSIKRELARNFVFYYRATFGKYPTHRQDVIEVLGWLFQIADIPDLNAEGCLRTAIKNAKSGSPWTVEKNSD